MPYAEVGLGLINSHGSSPSIRQIIERGTIGIVNFIVILRKIGRRCSKDERMAHFAQIISIDFAIRSCRNVEYAVRLLSQMLALNSMNLQRNVIRHL